MTHPDPTASTHDNSRTLAAVAYILTFITGLIIYFVAPKDDKYARWHAVQAIGFGLFALLISILLRFVPGGGFLGSLWGLAVIVGIVILAIRAYQGQPVRLPVIAEMADKHA